MFQFSAMVTFIFLIQSTYCFAQQSLKDGYETQHLRTSPEYTVLSEADALKQVRHGKDLIKTWNLINKNTSELFQCGRRPGMVTHLQQPSTWIQKKTYDECDMNFGGVCYNFGTVADHSRFRYIVDRDSAQAFLLGQYDVKLSSLLFAPRPRDLPRAMNNSKRISSIVAYTENKGLKNSFPDLFVSSSEQRCELFPSENSLYCQSSGGIVKYNCEAMSKAPVINILQMYFANFTKARALAECLSYNVENEIYQRDCRKSKWREFTDYH